MSLATLSVVPADDDPTSAFILQIQRRLDLGRAMRFAEMIDELSRQITSIYRHHIVFSSGTLNGTLHVPSYVREIAQGRGDRFPVIRATRVNHTTENLLVSEALRLSLTVARYWAQERGAEGKTGIALLRRLTRAEAAYPWAELRNLPRPPISTLIPIVRGRAVAGVISHGSPILDVCDLFGSDSGNPVAFQASAKAFAFAAATNPVFADRLFELVCLAWIIGGIRAVADQSVLNPLVLQGGGAEPILHARDGRTEVKVFFQTGRPLGAKRWRDRATMKLLAAIPDILLETRRNGETRFFVVDAKNRPQASDSSVAYKMLGYSENIAVRPFFGMAIFPSARRKITRRTLVRGLNQVTLLRVPLDMGSRVVRRVIRQMLSQRQ